MADDEGLLEACRQIELATARLYYFLAEAHAGHEISRLWLETAREEEDHARQFTMLRTQPKPPAMRVDEKRAAKALEVVETTLAGYQLERPSVEDALEEAITLEHSFAEYHAALAMEFDDDLQRRLFLALTAGDDLHLARLKAALEKYRSNVASR